MAISFTNYRLFIDPIRGEAYRDYQDLATVTALTATQGDKFRLEVYYCENTGVADFPMTVYSFPSGTLEVQVGLLGESDLISSTTSAATSTPTISADTVSGSLSPFSISGYPLSGFFKVVIANTSPALSATTAFIAYPISLSGMAEAIEAAVNAQAGWSAASCEVLQTGPLSGTISLTAVNSATTYTISGVTSNITFTGSSLTGLPGKTIELDFSDAAIGTFLGTDTSKDATLEVQIVNSGDRQTFIQLPVTIRAQVE